MQTSSCINSFLEIILKYLIKAAALKQLVLSKFLQVRNPALAHWILSHSDKEGLKNLYLQVSNGTLKERVKFHFLM